MFSPQENPDFLRPPRWLPEGHKPVTQRMGPWELLSLVGGHQRDNTGTPRAVVFIPSGEKLDIDCSLCQKPPFLQSVRETYDRSRINAGNARKC
jgi:hypothetical protein